MKKEVAIAVVAVSMSASCRRFRISGRFPFTKPSPKGSQTNFTLPPSTRNLTENSDQSRTIIGVSTRPGNLSEGSRTTGVIRITF